MNQTTLFKLGGIALAAWATLGSSQIDTKSFGILAVLMLLIALLDAGNGMQQTNEAGRPAGHEFAARFLSLSGAPLYLGLLALVFVTTNPSAGTASGGKAATHKASVYMCGGEGGGCGSGGCGSGGCGSSCGGSCGKSKAVAATAKPAPKPLTQEELRQRAETVQKRSLAAGGAAALPGVGANPRPLPPGLIPKADAPLPEGVMAPPGTPARNPAGAAPAVPTGVNPPATSSTSIAPASQAVSIQDNALPAGAVAQ
jgi:hypothetical protein